MIRRVLALTAMSLVLLGCTPLSKAPLQVSQSEAYSSAEQGRVLIRSGSLQLRAKDLDATKSDIEQITSEVGGRVENWSLQDNKWLNMKLRVPEGRLEGSMDRIAELGKVVGRSLSSRDVTEELIDLEIRLKNLQALRERLRSYLDQASNLEEILGVERELARVQSEIESLEAKLKLLKDQIAMSELNVRVTKARWL